MASDSERWRRWLDDAAVPAPVTTDARRRGGWRKSPASPAGGQATGSARTGRRVPVPVLAGAAAAVAVMVGALVAVSNRPADPDRPYRIVTTAAAAPSAAAESDDTTSAAAPPFCTPGRVGPALVTNTGGDLSTGEGAIAEYEYRYFARRDPAAVMEVTDSGPGVPGPAQVADGIATIPADAPWCVSITPTPDPHRFETSVRYQPSATAAPVTWLMVITVAPGEDGYRVVRIEDKPA